MIRFGWLTEAENKQLNRGIKLLEAFGDQGSKTGTDTHHFIYRFFTKNTMRKVFILSCKKSN